MKMPAIQFYPADWRKDPGVQALSFHDRGVWFEILCIMHESSERGVLMLNGAPIPESALARMLGLDNQILTTTLTTLLTYGVAKRRESDGAVYSKRMVNDEKLCKIRREAGKRGGNPVLLNQNQTTRDNQNPTPSSSSSSSSSISSNTPLPPKGDDGPLLGFPEDDTHPNPTPEDVIAFWNQFPTLTGVRDLTSKRRSHLKARLRERKFIENFEDAIEKASRTPFCIGQGPQGWVANIDWFIKPDTLTMLLEGKYDKKSQVSQVHQCP